MTCESKQVTDNVPSTDSFFVRSFATYRVGPVTWVTVLDVGITWTLKYTINQTNKQTNKEQAASLTFKTIMKRASWLQFLGISVYFFLN